MSAPADSDVEPIEALRAFLRDGRFAASGAVVTDLDGTAVLEREGRIYLPPSVELGLQHVHRRGRPVIANTLRFPLSVIRVFGDEWHRATGSDLPLVTLKGSQTGRIVRSAAREWLIDACSSSSFASRNHASTTCPPRVLVTRSTCWAGTGRYPTSPPPMMTIR